MTEYARQFNQDVAGFGGDVDYLKSTGDVRYYHDLGNDIVAMGRAQGGYVTPYGGQTLPLVSGFFGGPQLVRGFAPNGFGPRDITPGTTQDNVGGSAYWATSAELQAPILGLPPEIPLKAAGFADAGSVWGYQRRHLVSGPVAVADACRQQPNSLLDRRRPDLGFAVRRNAHRLRHAGHQGAL